MFYIFSDTVRVDLIPLGVKFTGKITLLFIPIEFPIFDWEADLIEGKFV